MDCPLQEHAYDLSVIFMISGNFILLLLEVWKAPGRRVRIFFFFYKQIFPVSVKWKEKRYIISNGIYQECLNRRISLFLGKLRAATWKHLHWNVLYFYYHKFAYYESLGIAMLIKERKDSNYFMKIVNPILAVLSEKKSVWKTKAVTLVQDKYVSCIQLYVVGNLTPFTISSSVFIII